MKYELSTEQSNLEDHLTPISELLLLSSHVFLLQWFSFVTKDNPNLTLISCRKWKYLFYLCQKP